MEYKLYCEIADLLEEQGRVIERQLEVLKGLVNENAEKENIINALAIEMELE